jgi:hypothetical protein
MIHPVRDAIKAMLFSVRLMIIYVLLRLALLFIPDDL